jgi:hypothetical protein
MDEPTSKWMKMVVKKIYKKNPQKKNVAGSISCQTCLLGLEETKNTKK